MKKILKKLLICICLFLTLFNFTMMNGNYVYAATFSDNMKNIFSGNATIGDTITSILSGIVGLLTWIPRLQAAVIPIIVQTIGGAVAKMDGTTPGTSTFVFLTPYHIIFNKINLTSIDFFNLTSPGTGTATNTIRVEIAKWYYIMRIIAIAILLAILIFVGIRMAITTVASEKAIYKKALFDWVTSLALVFLLHYIIRAVLWVNTGLVEIFEGIAASTNLDSLFQEMSELMFSVDFLAGVSAIIIYLMITVQTLMFLINYIKRMLTLAFLIIISPLITITYSIDKMGDQKAQALNTWLKEFSYNVLIQPFHCILYLVFVKTAIDLMATSTGFSAIAGSVLAIFCIKFVWDGEKIVRKIFGFEQASSLAAAAASGAVIGNMISKAQNVGKGAASGIKFAKNSKLGQAAKNSKLGQKIATKRENRKAEKYQKKAMKDLGFSGQSYNSLTDGQKSRVTRRAEERRTISNTRKEKVKKYVNTKGEKIKNRVKNSKYLRATGRAIATTTVAAAMYAMPDSNLVTSIGGGYAAGKSVGEGIKKLQENKKEHFEENIMKAWNNHCNITGNDKNSKEEFNKWYENTYNKGKQLDEYSQKNMGKAEGAARKELQEAGIDEKDLNSIITQLQRAILTKEPYDPAKLFSGYRNNTGEIDPSVIAAAVASYAARYNESYAYKNVSDYNEQMGQFGVTADDAVNGISDTEFNSYLTPPVQSFVQPEETPEVIETSTNTSEQLENEQLELVSQEYEDVKNNYDSDDISTERDKLAALESIVEGKLSDIETEIKNNLTNMGYDQSSKIDRIVDQIQSAVENINPDLGSLENQINNIVSNAMSKVDFRGVSEEKREEIQTNIREYTNKQVVNNYMTNNYGTSTTNVSFNADKIRSDLEKIANRNS